MLVCIATAGSSTCLIWQIFLPDALPDTAPKEFVSRSSLTYGGYANTE